MRGPKIIVLFAILVMTCAAGSFADGPGQDVLKVTGRGKAPADTPAAQAKVMAKRAAVLDGYRKLAVAAGYKPEPQEGTKEAAAVQAYLKNFTITATRYPSSHEAEVDIEMSRAVIAENVAATNAGASPDDGFAREMQSRLAGLEAELARLQDEVKRIKDELAKRGVLK